MNSTISKHLEKMLSVGYCWDVLGNDESLERSLCNVSQAADKILSGGVIVFPTETVYGLGASVRFPKAIARIYEIKGRPNFNPLICHIADWKHLEELVDELPDEAITLSKAFWPGPLTLVLPKKTSVSGLVTGGLEQVAVRWPKHEIAQDLIRRVGHPVAAPSANVSGRLSPTRLEHVWLQLGKKVDCYLDGGPAEAGLESTVIGWENGGPVLLRPGALAIETVEAALGRPITKPLSDRVQSPGQLLRHYAPMKPIEWENPRTSDTSDAVLLTLQEELQDRARYRAIRALSQEGDLQTAASQFFETLHELEASDVKKIIARPFPPHGLGAAINDRLYRAIETSKKSGDSGR